MSATSTSAPGAAGLDPAVASTLGLVRGVVDADTYARSVQRFREQGIALPTFAELADPARMPVAARAAAVAADRHGPDPRNLFRVHWYGGWDRADLVDVPEHVVLPSSLTGVDARIVVAFGNRFPMIGAHKVLAAYACLAPRVISGQLDPTRHRAVWPSTGNYARGGVAISRIMGCRGVAVLPAGMSQERFDWLDRWVADPADVIRTPGTESNVKEIYDACHVLAADPDNFVLNQFCEFANHLAHLRVTGPALERVVRAATAGAGDAWRLAAFVSASGSAGTLGAGDHLKEALGADVVAVEALECPTLLYNGFGDHNIQGIGDKHVPLIHNVTGTDVVVGVSDSSTDALDVLAGTDAGRAHLVDRRGVDPAIVAQLTHLGLSSWCNVLAAIKLAKLRGYGPDDVIVTVATDGSELYPSERQKVLAREFADGFGEREAAVVAAQHLDGQGSDHVLELDAIGRRRIFNLGYFTWVEQQGVPLDVFEARRHPSFWRSLRPFVDEWDDAITEFNGRTGVLAGWGA
jgi:cysteine synthase